MTVRRVQLLILPIASFLTITHLASTKLPAQTYTYTTFDVPGAGTNTGQGSNALGINDYGVVVGSYFDTANNSHGFIRALNGDLTSFDAPNDESIDGGGTSAEYIDNAGEVAGQVDEKSPIYDTIVQAGFLRSPSGTFQLVVLADDSTFLTHLNSQGSSVGTVTKFNAKTETSFVRDSNGTTTPIAFPGATYTAANWINSAGTITGNYGTDFGPESGFVRAPDGTLTSFNVQDLNTDPVAINDNGVIAGTASHTNTAIYGFVRQPNGLTHLFSSPPFSIVSVSGINNSGDVTGSLETEVGSGAYTGFVRLANGTIVTLAVPGATSTFPSGINALGAVVGTYTTGGLCCQVSHGFIATLSNESAR